MRLLTPHRHAQELEALLETAPLEGQRLSLSKTKARAVEPLTWHTCERNTPKPLNHAPKSCTAERLMPTSRATFRVSSRRFIACRDVVARVSRV